MEHYVETTHDGRVIRMAILGKLTIEEYGELSLEVQQRMRETKERVHIIVDSFAMTSYPVSVALLKKHTVWVNEVNFASLHHVSTNRFVTMIGEVTIGLMMKQYRAVATLDEAYEAIYVLDSSVQRQ